MTATNNSTLEKQIISSPKVENIKKILQDPLLKKPTRLIGLDLRSMLKTKPPQFDFVLPGLRLGNSGILASPGGVGKSYFILQAAIQIASGVQFMNFDTKQGNVVYVSIEDDKDALHSRFNAIVEKFLPNEADREKIFSNLIIHCPTPGEIDLISKPEWLETACYQARLLIIDTMRLAHTGDENDPVQMAKFVAQLTSYARDHQTSIALLAHSTKSSALNGQAELAQSLRGSSVLTDNLRWQSYMVGMTAEEAETSKCSIDNKIIGAEKNGNFVRFGISKTNYGSKGEPKWYMRGDFGILIPCTIEKIKKTHSKPVVKNNKKEIQYA